IALDLLSSKNACGIGGRLCLKMGRQIAQLGNQTSCSPDAQLTERQRQYSRKIFMRLWYFRHSFFYQMHQKSTQSAVPMHQDVAHLLHQRESSEHRPPAFDQHCTGYGQKKTHPEVRFQILLHVSGHLPAL
ncbi:MAG: hypothetical protein RR075_07065, partial [Pygmaiobacter sp.]